MKEKLSRILANPSTPYWFGFLILCAAGIGVFMTKFPSSSLLPFSRPAVVLFDPVKFVNAQRAAASFVAMTKNQDAALAITQVAKQAEAVIIAEARGAVVLVKQAVVAPDGIPDITDAVLERFGLATDVPTVTTNSVSMGDDSLESIAPTDNAFSQGKLREDYRLELEAKRDRIAQEQSRQQSQANILP